MNDGNIGEIVYLANKYDIPALVSSCSTSLMKRVTLTNVVDCLDLALRFENSSRELKAKCGRIVRSNTLNVLKSSAFFQCNKDVLLEILSLDSSSCAEEIIFDACVEWAQAKCEEQQLTSNGENMRLALGTCFPLIRFKEMAQNIFYERLKQYE